MIWLKRMNMKKLAWLRKKRINQRTEFLVNKST